MSQRTDPAPFLRSMSVTEWDELVAAKAEREAGALMKRDEADAFLARTPLGARWVFDIHLSRAAQIAPALTDSCTVDDGMPGRAVNPPGGAASIDQAA